MAEQWLKRTPIRRSGGAPIYVQLAQILHNEILAREEKEFALPSEGELSNEFHVSRITVRQALKQLESRGVIYSEQGRGYFKTIPRMKGVSGFHSFTSEVRKLGREPSSRLLEFWQDQKLPGSFREHLQPNAQSEDRFTHLRRVRMIDGIPVALEDAYLPQDLFAITSRERFEQGSLYEQMVETWGVVPSWTDALFEPLVATQEEAEILQIDPGAPALAVWRVTLTDTDQVCEYVRSIYKGGGFMLSVNRYRL